MSPRYPWPIQEIAFDREARSYLEYLRTHHPEHFMEGVAQARQRAITVESFDWVRGVRPGVHICNELLIQWYRPGEKKPGQVVPDNMVVLSEKPLRASLSFNVPLEPAPPFWVFEYTSKQSERKDTEVSFDKYEKELKVPYYLLFYPDTQDLTLYRHNRRKYVSVKPNGNDRYAVEPLEMELALLDGWVRYWYKGKLVPLPDELQRDLTQAQQQAEQATRQAEQEKRRADDLQSQLAALQEQLTRLQRPDGE